MTDDRSLERAARSWLDEGPTRAPDRPVETALARIQSTSQERTLALPWRLSATNPLVRVAGAAIVAVLAAGAVFLLARPTSDVGPPPTIAPTSSPAGSASPTMELPAARPLTPTAVIDLAGMVMDTIPLTSDGTDVWIGVDGAVIHVDGRTNATVRLDVANMATGNGDISIASDGLWIADYHGGRIERVDPGTGAVELQASVAEPPHFWFLVGEDLWLGTGGNAAGGMYRVDRETGALGSKIGANSIGVAFGLGEIWSGEWDGVEGGHYASNLVTRVDPGTGDLTGTIDVPPGAGCAVAGEFPDNIWAGCPADFGTCPANRIAVRIDPSTNKVATTARICGNVAFVLNGTPWFSAGRKDGNDTANSLVAVDAATGQLLAQLDLGKVDWDVMVLTDTALWISDEQGDRVLRYDLAAIRP